jgi:hypothetical protein
MPSLVRVWILVLNPPRLRPSACAAWPPLFWCASRIGMGMDDHAIQQQMLRVRAFSKVGMHSTPYPFVAPACEPPVHAVPLAVFVGQ